MSTYTIALLAGDGIGPEIMDEAVKILRLVESRNAVTFDLKPAAPKNVRGEFQPIASVIPGVQICEHLPGLAQRSRHWGLVRSLTHRTNGHTLGHYFMLTGRSGATPGFKGDRVDQRQALAVGAGLGRVDHIGQHGAQKEGFCFQTDLPCLQP